MNLRIPSKETTSWTVLLGLILTHSLLRINKFSRQPPKNGFGFLFSFSGKHTQERLQPTEQRRLPSGFSQTKTHHPKNGGTSSPPKGREGHALPGFPPPSPQKKRDTSAPPPKKKKKKRKRTFLPPPPQQKKEKGKGKGPSPSPKKKKRKGARESSFPRPIDRSNFGPQPQASTSTPRAGSGRPGSGGATGFMGRSYVFWGVARVLFRFFFWGGEVRFRGLFRGAFFGGLVFVGVGSPFFPRIYREATRIFWGGYPLH